MAGPWSLVAYSDFLLLMAATTWVENEAELTKLIPVEEEKARKIGPADREGAVGERRPDQAAGCREEPGPGTRDEPRGVARCRRGPVYRTLGRRPGSWAAQTVPLVKRAVVLAHPASCETGRSSRRHAQRRAWRGRAWPAPGARGAFVTVTRCASPAAVAPLVRGGEGLACTGPIATGVGHRVPDDAMAAGARRCWRARQQRPARAGAQRRDRSVRHALAVFARRTGAAESARACERRRGRPTASSRRGTGCGAARSPSRCS